jgi:Cytochrome c biogenesis factor
MAAVLAGLLASAMIASPEDVAALLARAELLRSTKDYSAAALVLREAAALDPANRHVQLLLAEILNWSGKFADAESIYRGLLQQQPRDRDTRLGLGRALLWQRHFRQARSLFQEIGRDTPGDLDAAEGAAMAAYWAGDWKTAAIEFQPLAAGPQPKADAARSIREIAAATRGEQRLSVDAVDDDQPFRSLRAEVSQSFFSDPLTRWSVAGGSYELRDRTLDLSLRRSITSTTPTRAECAP